jgi:putative DNA primase/helicase
MTMTTADKAPAPIANSAPTLLVTRASDIKYRPINWLWPGRIARAKLTLLAGASGSGKSGFATSIMAAVSTGGIYPCGEGRAPQGSTVLISPDGDPDVLIPGLKAAGADLARVHLIRDLPGPKGPRPFDLATDLPSLDAYLHSIKDLRLVVVDAMSLPTGRAAAARGRALLDALAKVAEVHNVALIAVLKPPGGDRALRKPAGVDPLALGAARTAFAIEADPSDEKRRLVLQVKNELAPDCGILAFRVTAHQTDPGQSAARLAFEPQHHPLSLRAFKARQARSFNSAKAEAIEFVRGLMGSAAQVRIRHVAHAARAAGLLRHNQALSQCRLLREARMSLGLAISPEVPGSDTWVWAKPHLTSSTPPAQAQTRQPALNAA